MTVGELKKKLEKYPDPMDVFIAERTSDFTFGSLESVSSKEINFMEAPDSKPLSKDTVVVLSDEI